MIRSLLIAITLGVWLILSGCQIAGTQAEPQNTLAPLASDASPAERAVDALARARQSAELGDARELANQLSRIEALGVRFDDAEDRSDIARWRAQADMPPPMRGPVGGPAVRRGTIAPGASVEFGQAFLAGESAAIAIQAWRGPAVEISVANGQDETVCVRRSRRGSCNWTPLFTQRHTITISNSGSQAAQYHLAIE